MSRDHLLRDPSLSLPALAQAIGATANAVSQAVNQQTGLSVRDFLNRQRVEEAKILLTSPEHRTDTILDIALTVGFNSKSTFHVAFKKFADGTPSDFRDGKTGKIWAESGSAL